MTLAFFVSKKCHSDTKTWFLDQEIPAGGFVRIVADIGKASGRNENHHDGRSDNMPGPRTRMDNH